MIDCGSFMCGVCYKNREFDFYLKPPTIPILVYVWHIDSSQYHQFVFTTENLIRLKKENPFSEIRVSLDEKETYIKHNSKDWRNMQEKTSVVFLDCYRKWCVQNILLK